MNPLWVLLSVLIGANLGGVFGSTLGALTGALVAIPVGGAVQVVFREVWERTRAVPAPGTWDDAATGPPGTGSGVVHAAVPSHPLEAYGPEVIGDGRTDTAGGQPVP